MKMNIPFADSCLRATMDAAKDVSRSVLGIESDPIEVPHLECAGFSSFISLVGTEIAAQVCLSTTACGGRHFAGLLLGMSSSESEQLDDADVVDALGEFVNIIAGMVKTSLFELIGECQMGLPTVASGNILPGGDACVRTVTLKVSDHLLKLVVQSENRASFAQSTAA